mmetsp:Transcript_25894/g.61429  ORF Transcript_25894/g.61429 Transcript_25894/m.61429 type:complete len:492 (-) Transcript_25894:1233-2708(-)
MMISHQHQHQQHHDGVVVQVSSKPPPPPPPPLHDEEQEKDLLHEDNETVATATDLTLDTMMTLAGTDKDDTSSMESSLSCTLAPPPPPPPAAAAAAAAAGGGGGGGGMMSFGGPSYFWGPSPFDFFYYRPYGGYGYYGQPVTERPRDPEEMGFLESIFSFVFGDGNPNQGLEEQRLTFVAQMIRDNKGAVTAEQLAPYCDAPDPDSSSTTSSDNKYIDESFVLPIVSQLDGQPRVTEEGDIIYVFPELQVSATESRVVPQASEQNMILKRAGLPPNVTPKEIQNLLMMNGISTRSARDKQDLIDILEKALPPMTPEEEDEMLQSDPTMLMEREYKFSVASGLNKFFAGALGVVNLGGALYLGNLFNQYALYNVRLPSFLGVAQTFYPLLVGYAILFNAIPFVRNLWISSENAKIQKRNDARKKWRERALQPSQTIIRKLKAARKFATNRKLLTEQDIVYDTKQTATDLQQDRNKNDLDEFDKLLNEQKPFQ